MFPLWCSLAVLCAPRWTVGSLRVCNTEQTEVEDQCCDKCPPGTYLKAFCTEHNQTLCNPCEEGYFSDAYTFFDRCEKCQSCSQQYVEKCTLTTNAKCSCSPGFLCSDNVCSDCKKNEDVVGKTPNTTVADGKYSNNTVCPGDAYFDVKANICKPWTQCSTLGLAEFFPGNKTHNAVCIARVLNGDIFVAFGIGIVLLSVSILIFVSRACIKYLKKDKPSKNPVLAVSTNTDFHLSKEESGLQLITQDDCNDCKSFSELRV
ncbi:tumor necrosis factor receptor superfamily member 18 [Echeneis naucrates]|uniref:tumor necrosis factor receptor superfamily member 18 n=1 Tax=Echeneis naucrates TaxID=173247 RepID=UPI0011140C12|nr:tumor necrosis factor receptor superfamily member 9 [Echeneis naucrates]